MKDQIETKLKEGLSPSLLEITDQSALHAGHAGAKPGGETHFKVRVESARFQGLSRVEQHRLVYSILALELNNGVHALALETIALNQ